MKNIIKLALAAAVFALPVTGFAAHSKACEKCCKGKCAECCKAKGKECGKECCVEKK